MNLTLIIVFIFLGVIVPIYGVYTYNEPAIFVGIVIFIIGGMFSFLLPLGKTNVTIHKDFSIEHTANRVIINYDNKDYQFFEARVVNNVDKIKEIKVTTDNNMWGVEVERKVSVILAD